MLGSNVDQLVCLACPPISAALFCSSRYVDASPTSIVSNTLTTPGWRNVLSFLSAFFAKGRRERFALMSKEKMLHFELSS
jgi:hypothetical protein